MNLTGVIWTTLNAFEAALGMECLSGSGSVRSSMYALRGGFLVRPLVIAVVLGSAGAVLSSIEETTPQISSWIRQYLFPSHDDPGVAQLILSSIATSIMTVVSIVFAILLMTLTLASTQFSPRILISFVRDRTTQWTLGIFLGTFSYCMATLPAARSLATSVRADRQRHRRDAICARLCRLAHLLHQSHFTLDQRQPHRRPRRARHRARHRRIDALSARSVSPARSATTSPAMTGDGAV